MQNVSILIVEDEIIHALYIKKQFELEGIQNLKTVPSGEKAVDFALREKPDVILMDIRLAGKIDGIEAAKQILEAYETNIIFMTGYDSAEIYQKAMELKPMGYILKPFDIEKIIILFKSSSKLFNVRNFKK